MLNPVKIFTKNGRKQCINDFKKLYTRYTLIPTQTLKNMSVVGLVVGINF